MPCQGCIQARQAFVSSASAGNVRGMASALHQAWQINVEKARQVALSHLVDRQRATLQETQSGNYRPFQYRVSQPAKLP